MVYNLTQIAQTNTTLGLVQGTNSVLMQGWLGIMMLIVISAILFMSFVQRTNNPSKAMAATAVIAFGLSMLLRAINLIPDLAIFVTLILAGASIAIIKKE